MIRIFILLVFVEENDRRIENNIGKRLINSAGGLIQREVAREIEGRLVETTGGGNEPWGKSERLEGELKNGVANYKVEEQYEKEGTEGKIRPRSVNASCARERTGKGKSAHRAPGKGPTIVVAPRVEQRKS